MNYKFRKKPVVIEAFQMTNERRFDNSQWPNWLHIAWNEEEGAPGSLYCKNGGDDIFTGTLEGEHKVSWGDYIIQGISGEIYPCKPDIFQMTYDKEEKDNG